MTEAFGLLVLSRNMGLSLSLQYVLFPDGVHCLADLAETVILSVALSSPLVGQVSLAMLRALVYVHSSFNSALLNMAASHTNFSRALH